jgi:hypothetical protein
VISDVVIMPRPRLTPKTDLLRLKRDQTKNRIRNSSLIVSNGFVADFPCDFCRGSGLDCMMNENNQKCAACTRRGRPCERRFHSDREWNALQEAENKIKSDLELAESELEASLAAHQELLAKVRRLRKHQQFIRERGINMRSHNQKVLEILDSENPPSDAEVAAADAAIMQEQLEHRVLAATSEEFDELLANLGQLPSGSLGASDDIFLESARLPQGSR